MEFVMSESEFASNVQPKTSDGIQKEIDTLVENPENNDMIASKAIKLAAESMMEQRVKQSRSVMRHLEYLKAQIKKKKEPDVVHYKLTAENTFEPVELYSASLKASITKLQEDHDKLKKAFDACMADGSSEGWETLANAMTEAGCHSHHCPHSI